MQWRKEIIIQAKKIQNHYYNLVGNTDRWDSFPGHLIQHNIYLWHCDLQNPCPLHIDKIILDHQ